jgi:hypothetical protein
VCEAYPQSVDFVAKIVNAFELLGTLDNVRFRRVFSNILEEGGDAEHALAHDAPILEPVPFAVAVEVLLERSLDPFLRPGVEVPAIVVTVVPSSSVTMPLLRLLLPHPKKLAEETHDDLVLEQSEYRSKECTWSEIE